MSERRNVLLLWLVAAVFFLDVLLLGSSFYTRDLYRYHYPMKQVVRETIARGDLPLWNRWFSGGQPMAANPAYEIFYPPQWLIFVGSYHFGWGLHILAHVLIALAGMYAFLRALTLSPPAAIFGALSFGLGGFLLGAISVLPTFFVWSLAPLAALTVLRFLEEGTPRRFAVAALILGMQLVIGEPVALMQVWALLALLVIVKTRRPIWIVALGIAAFLVAAVQLIPAIDHAGDSSRARGFALRDVVDYSMPVVRPLELLVPHLFGRLDPAKPGAFWGAETFARGTPYFVAVSSGIAVAIFALAGFFARAPGWRATLAVCGVSYLLAIGDSTPLFRIGYELGIVRSIRYPEKFFATAIVVLIVFAASVVDRVDRKKLAAAAAVVLGAHIVLLAMAANPELFLRVWGLPPHRGAHASSALVAWGLDALIAAGWLALYLAPPARRQIAALLLLLINLGLFANDVSPRMPRDYFDPPPVDAFLAGDRDAFVVFHRGDWLPGSDAYRAQVIASHVWLVRNGLRPYVPSIWNVRTVLEPDYDETALLPTHDLLAAMKTLGDSGFRRWSDPFLAITGVRYVLDYRPPSPGHDAETAIPITVFRLNGQPRYFFPRAIVEARTIDDVLDSMRRNPFPIDTAFVPFSAVAPASARVLAIREGANAATIDVESSDRALLVATVTRHKYWTATIDGKPAEIVPANIAFQGVIVPAGRHRIEMRYRNPLLLWSGLISLLTIAALVALTIRRPPPRPPRSES